MGQASRPTSRVTAPPRPAIQRPNCRARLEGAFPSPGGPITAGIFISWGDPSTGLAGRAGGAEGWYNFTRPFGRRPPERAEPPNSVMPITLLHAIPFVFLLC